MTSSEARQYESEGHSPYDLYGALSGYGGDCPEGIPVEFGLLAILAAFGVAFGVLYVALTMTVGKRKKRSEESDGTCEAGTIQGYYGCHIEQFMNEQLKSDTIWIHIADVLWLGLEEFEEKIDKIAEGQDDADGSWISQIYNQFSFFNDDVDNKLTEADMDGIEPPLLDETWGLGIRNSSSFKSVSANTTISEPVKLDESRKKREATEEETEDVVDENMDVEEKCRVDMWRCLSRVIEGGLHYIDNPDGLYGIAKKTMFKVAFHGGVSNMWTGLMTIPEARQIKKCMTSHQECISYEVLRREAQETMDPADPEHDIYDKKTKGEKGVAKSSVAEKKHKRERLIVNPEFVESLTQGDGSEQFDDYSTNEV